VTAIVQLVKDGYGAAAIPSLFVRDYLDNGEFVELPVQPLPPSIILSMCLHANADMLVHAAGSAARLACAGYCAQVDQRHIEMLRYGGHACPRVQRQHADRSTVNSAATAPCADQKL
jgi:hypothetical protein